MKKSILRKYARLIAVQGAGIQKGQYVIVEAELDQPDFVRMLVEECYKAGAAKVLVNWNDQSLLGLDVRYQRGKALTELESWEVERLRWMTEKLPCRIYLMSEDPDGLKRVNAQRLTRRTQARSKVAKPYRNAIEGKHQWCIAAVPGEAWAHKLFPTLRRSQAVEKLWEAILATVRVTEDNDPVAAWQAHNANLQARCDYLNSLDIDELEYRAGNGTNLRVGMMPRSQFCGGSEFTVSGVEYNPNMPSEECFVSPMRGRAEGVVYASKPLSYQGQLIENFWFRFAGGKVVEAHAEKNEALLQKLVAMDESAAYLGECALVPYDSPIQNSGLLFYNTLFDENAACHLALGMGFVECIRDGSGLTMEEAQTLGLNDSIVHEDFMIGTADLAIDAHCRDGRTVPIFRDGNWAF